MGCFRSNKSALRQQDVVIIDRFESSVEAMNRYGELRKDQPQREYCFFHTSRENLVARKRYVGIRGLR